MGFHRIDGYTQLFGNFIDRQSVYAQPDDLTLFGGQFINIKIQLPEQLFTDSRHKHFIGFRIVFQHQPVQMPGFTLFAA